MLFEFWSHDQFVSHKNDHEIKTLKSIIRQFWPHENRRDQEIESIIIRNFNLKKLNFDLMKFDLLTLSPINTLTRIVNCRDDLQKKLPLHIVQICFNISTIILQDQKGERCSFTEKRALRALQQQPLSIIAIHPWICCHVCIQIWKHYIVKAHKQK